MALRGLRQEYRVEQGLLEGYASEYHRFPIRMHLDHLKYLEQTVAQLQIRIDEKMKPSQCEIHLICTTPGFDVTSAQHAFVEIGGDIKPFPSERHLAS
ncbi:hypothetical protein ACFLXD_06645 [Chloroflexota bacterium]